MGWIKTHFDKIILAVLPIPFIGSCFFNCLTFFLDGHEHGWLRSGITLGMQAIALCLILIELVRLWIHEPANRDFIKCSIWILVVFFAAMVLALLMQHDIRLVLEYAVVSGGYLFAYYCAFLVIFLKRLLPQFLTVCRYYAVAFVPMMIYYCVRFYLPSAEYGVTELGVYPSMSLAYSLVTLCVILMADTILYQKPATRAFRLNIALYVLFSITLTLASSKGPILCLLFAAFLIPVYCLKTKRPTKQSLAFPAWALVAVVLFSTVLYPSYGVENRWIAFLKELVSPESVSMSVEDLDSAQNIIAETTPPAQTDPSQQTPPTTETDPSGKPTPPPEKEPSEDTEYQDVVGFFTSGQADEALQNGTITQEEYDQIAELSRKLNNTASGGQNRTLDQRLEGNQTGTSHRTRPPFFPGEIRNISPQLLPGTCNRFWPPCDVPGPDCRSHHSVLSDQEIFSNAIPGGLYAVCFGVLAAAFSLRQHLQCGSLFPVWILHSTGLAASIQG